jgi:hypothetical protein
MLGRAAPRWQRLKAINNSPETSPLRGYFMPAIFPLPEVTVMVAFFISITTPSVTTEVRDYENA